MARRLRFALIAIVIVVLSPPILALIWLTVKLKLSAARWLAVFYHRFFCRVLNVRVEVIGEVDERRPLLLVANHVSWLDIPVIGTIAPLTFIAKKEVGTWPVIGQLASLQRTIYLDRERRTTTLASATEIAGRLAGGDPAMLFAEGTSSDGNRVLPFKSAIVGAAEALAEGSDQEVWLQPMAIAYTRLNGMPMGRQHRPVVAWYGTTDLVPHLIGVFMAGPVDVEVVFGEPIQVATVGGRKEATRLARAEVRRMLGEALTGRRPDPADTVVEVVPRKVA
ncbi:MAG: lysophospholipid acyltransferase family protein [Pseudomonadota bacterium]